MPQQDTALQNCVARALYDNVAESPDELAFRKGDLLTLLEQNTGGIEGWWLCSLRGRQGICPGNRLRLLAGIFDIGQTVEPDNELSFLQRQGKRRSWHVQPNKVLTPQKCGDVYLYDMPSERLSLYDVPPATHISVIDSAQGRSAVPSRCSTDIPDGSSCSGESYDIPSRPALVRVRRDSGDSYDVPRPLAPPCLLQQAQLTPSSSASSLTADSMSSSNRSSLAPEYDIPKSRGTHPQLYDIPSTSVRELPLELGSALDMLARLQTEATSAISRLLGFANPNWRTRETMEPRIMDLKLAVVRLRTSLHDLTDFAEGTLGNAAKANDKGLALKLRPLVKALREANRLVQETSASLDAHDWSPDILCIGNEQTTPDSLDQLVSCARVLTEDVRQVTSFIQGNSTLLFKRTTLSQNNNGDEVSEDYDYVNLNLKDTSATEIDNESARTPGEELDSDEQQVLLFYAAQVITNVNNLTHAIDAFLQTVEHNQPPKVFLAHGKFVVLSAHRLVHIGDTVHRNLSHDATRERILHCTNRLSESLATTVHKTKKAGLQFPSVTAVQEMVDSVVDVSHLARDLKISLIHAVQQL